MKAERLQQIDGIFQTAIELPPERRREFLDTACANDPDLRSEVESLISSFELSGDFIEGSAADVAASLLASETLRGKQVAQFQIGNPLGRGGMGEVYAATDRMGRQVALKVLAPWLVQDRQHVTRFLQEARAVLALNHPNIVTVYDIGEADGVYYIASELIEGETLRAVLSRGRPALAQSVDIAIQVSTALVAAHDKGVVHRDIKPENVMLRGDGYVKVLDFGIAKLTEQFGGAERSGATAAASLETVAGLIVGTTPYMSPEQARGTPVDARTDVWSCGVLLYEMIASQIPFTGDSTTDVLARILEREPAPLASLVEGTPEELQRIVTRALKKDPGERYPTMADMLADLKALRQDLEFGEKIRRIQSTGELARAPGPRLGGRKIVVSIAGIGVLALAVAYFATPWFRSPNIQSVAILPFVNATGDPELEYLSDGVTESLINALGQLPDMSVKARSMVFRYKGKEVDPQEVASALSVDAVVNGRVERRGDRLMLSLDLAKGEDGDHLWGERYDSTMTDLVAVQSGMARDIAERLHTRLSGADEQRIAQSYTASGEAYQLYLRGRYHVQKVVLPEEQTGIQYLEQSTALDPNYALAYVGLADAYRTASAADLTPSQVVPKAEAAAERAVQIDPDLSMAHTQLGILAIWYNFDPHAAERHFTRALELDPDNAEAHIFFAHLRSNQGRHDEAIREAERGLELEPFNSRFNALTGQFLVHAGRPDDAIARLQSTIDLDPNHVLARLFIATAYVEQRRYADAIAAAQVAVDRTRRRLTHPLGVLGYALAKSGNVAQARAVVDELVTASQSRYVSPYSVALVFNALGERDETLAWLERGFEVDDHKMNLLKVDPKWKNLHGDPRFEDLVKRIGF
jgi:serine/threonine protein kinase/tetratricopeptide (TPR) repeat protein